ncbi:MAG: hypothetical protein NZ703_01440 [Gemmataceae bacterium]|nr:hypothetical protein [Gemmataceae bacterium]MCS7269721.1 hypothetical protein [Gemmataceae bacterium]MDW8243746.1 hypothetical protein [Thermogemmata sp.]
MPGLLGKSGWYGVWWAICLLTGGCADTHLLQQSCPRPSAAQAAARQATPHPAYRLSCGDVVEVRFVSQPQWDALCAVDLDGRLPLGLPVEPRVEGRTLTETQLQIAQMLHLAPEEVVVRLIEPRGQYLFVHGPIRGRLRMVPYQGPETVFDFLQRIGGLPPGTQLRQVYVVRPRVAQGLQPQVYRCDAWALLHGLPTAWNVPLQPGDIVYVGETASSVLARFLPDWLEPLYCRLMGLWPEQWFFPTLSKFVPRL